jgi:dienelactone hydrolase
VGLLRPSGLFGTGTITAELTDPDRPAHLATSRMGRSLRVQVWYPASATPGAAPLVWNALRRNAATPLPLRALLALIRTRTTAIPQAKILAGPSLPLVVYNHGMVSFADENTSLMEDLASHGYIVLAIEHAEQMQELQALNRSRSSEQRRQDAVLVRQLRQVSRDERSRLAPEYYRASPVSCQIVIERAHDTAFVLRRVKEVMGALPGISSDSVDPEHAHLIGYSIGGAVSMEVARNNTAALSVVSIDGGLQGSLRGQPIRTPVLMLYSEANEGINDELLPPHAEKLTLPGTTHLSFHDVSLLLPFLRYLGATGKLKPAECLAHRNQAVLTFIARAGDLQSSALQHLGE